MKSFRGDILKFYKMLQADIPFAFARFSDGCEAILKNYKLEITDSKVIFGDITYNKGFSKEDHKSFNPEKHKWFREKLWQAFIFNKDNYYRGICCPCCVGKERNDWFKNILVSEKNLTWANLFVNFNYDFFIDSIIPIFSKKEIILICNENANIQGLPFKIIKDFRIGNNRMIEDYIIIDKIKEFTGQSSAERVYLFSASSLSNILIHELYEYNNKNTYLNIGTTLNNYLGLSIDRDYLLARWKYKQPFGLSHRNCIW